MPRALSRELDQCLQGLQARRSICHIAIIRQPVAQIGIRHGSDEADWYSPGVSEQQADLSERADASDAGDAEAFVPRRRSGEPHPYMLQRNPPNLWILVFMTVFSLVMAVVVLAVTIVL